MSWEVSILYTVAHGAPLSCPLLFTAPQTAPRQVILPERQHPYTLRLSAVSWGLAHPPQSLATVVHNLGEPSRGTLPRYNEVRTLRPPWEAAIISVFQVPQAPLLHCDR